MLPYTHIEINNPPLTTQILNNDTRNIYLALTGNSGRESTGDVISDL